MKNRLIPILTAVCMIAVGFASAPAKATPTLTVAFDGKFLAFGGSGSFADVNIPLGLGLSSDQVDALDGVAAASTDFDGYGTFFLLNYTITPDDPSPSTPRNWALDIDLGFDGTVVGFDTAAFMIPFDETILDMAFGITFPVTGIPVSDLTGPFSLLDVADLGVFAHLFLSGECIPATEIGPGIGACLYAPDLDLLSGLIAVGLSPGFTEFLLLELDPVLPPGTEVIDIDFGGELVLRAVPEPGSLAIIGLGLVALGVARRRRAA